MDTWITGNGDPIIPNPTIRYNATMNHNSFDDPSRQKPKSAMRPVVLDSCFLSAACRQIEFDSDRESTGNPMIFIHEVDAFSRYGLVFGSDMSETKSSKATDNGLPETKTFGASRSHFPPTKVADGSIFDGFCV